MKQYLRYLPYLLAILLIINVFGFDLLSYQTVFLLDYVPTPIRVWDWSYQWMQPLVWIVHDLLSYSLGYVGGSKLYLLIIMIVTLLLGYHWGEYIAEYTGFDKSLMTSLTMFIMVFNPVFSSRMGTQPSIWLGMILLGWGLYVFVRYRNRLQFKHIVWVGLYWGSAMMTMNHASFMILVALVVFVLCRPQIKTLGYTVMIGGLVGLLNLNRIIGGLIGSNSRIDDANTFSQQNIEEFMTYEHSGLGPIVTSVMGYGFRGEKYGSAFTPTWSNPRRRVAGLVLIMLGVFGWLYLYRSNKMLAYYIGLLAIISVILGVGIASDSIAGISQWLYDTIPGYRGLREPHKWIGLYIMLLIPCIVYGYMSLVQYFKGYMSPLWTMCTMMLLCIAWSPGSMYQLMTRYDATDYPQTYNQTRDFLIQQGTGNWIQLPWHSYHRCQWTNKVIANHLRQFSEPAKVIASDNIEIGQLYTNSTNPRSQAIEKFIADHDLTYLDGYNIQGIIYLTQCADFPNYQWITTHSGLKLLQEYDDVQIYMIR